MYIMKYYSWSNFLQIKWNGRENLGIIDEKDCTWGYN
jgi:hypothetical protein